MFPTARLLGGLLWKRPWRLSPHQKLRQRRRLRRVDNVVDVVEQALAKAKQPAIAALERWRLEMPTEDEMEPKDKYTVFDPKERKYRKAIHKVPKWTRVSQRINPPGY